VTPTVTRSSAPRPAGYELPQQADPAAVADIADRLLPSSGPV
jgi:hypothetical protein